MGGRQNCKGGYVILGRYLRVCHILKNLLKGGGVFNTILSYNTCLHLNGSSFWSTLTVFSMRNYELEFVLTPLSRRELFLLLSICQSYTYLDISQQWKTSISFPWLVKYSTTYVPALLTMERGFPREKKLFIFSSTMEIQ